MNYDPRFDGRKFRRPAGSLTAIDFGLLQHLPVTLYMVHKFEDGRGNGGWIDQVVLKANSVHESKYSNAMFAKVVTDRGYERDFALMDFHVQEQNYNDHYLFLNRADAEAYLNGGDLRTFSVIRTVETIQQNVDVFVDGLPVAGAEAVEQLVTEEVVETFE
jgi:hypothetical protein